MRNFWLSAAAVAVIAVIAAACNSNAPATTAPAATVSLQLQWAPQAQFAGYFAADKQGYYTAQGLTVNFIPGGPDVVPQTVGSDPAGPEFTISWVPKVLEVRAKGQSDLVDIAQVFQRAGTRSVSWASGKGPAPTGTDNITDPSMFRGKNVGVWDFGNEYEVTAGALKAGLTQGTDYTKVIQPFDMTLLLSRQIDVAEAMIYNEYAQVLEATNPQTNALYQPTDLNVIDYNQVGTAMLQDAVFSRAAWLSQPGNTDVATRFLRASFQGWIYCRDHPADCVQYTTDAGSTLGAGHQAWMMNEINPLVWPSPDGIGIMPVNTWNQTVSVTKGAGIITADPDAGAYRTDLAQAALTGISGDTKGANFQKGTVTVTAGGK
ncbi:MAG TPA: ABC transporter substrate-binding protein [Candidatus Limnocylindrales bacterium]|jgi:NitT/TauT family transport system substrate-binding protein